MSARAQRKVDDEFNGEYTAKDIEVLEGLEPVRRRPGMYIGDTGERGLHHLFAEVLDNSMDEAIAGHADRIEIIYGADGFLDISDNGRGIPIDPHPKFPKKSALEVILTTLHAGGKFTEKNYTTSGGLHGVGISVVNALSDSLVVEVFRNRLAYAQSYAYGKPLGPLKQVGTSPNRRGTNVRFRPDPKIFGKDATFKAARLYQMAKAKAYLHRGVEIRWRCDPSHLPANNTVPAEAVLRAADGLKDFLIDMVGTKNQITSAVFAGRVKRGDAEGAVEWAVTWVEDPGDDESENVKSFCNAIPTPDGGAHEAGLKTALTKGLKAYGELKNDRRANLIAAEDVAGTAMGAVSVFIRDPKFQGQTKDRLMSPEAAKLVENVVRDAFDHWLAGAPKEADRLLDWVVTQAEERLRRRKERDVARQSATRRLRLPGKLADCARAGSDGTELFIVEGDSAGGSAKQARDRATQAVLPLRGKILNIASATGDKARNNQELSDLALAMGVVSGKVKLEDMRYERIVIMTDADVDGAHIAALLITFFYRAMPELVKAGRLYMAMPPLYRITQGTKTGYASDQAHLEKQLKTTFSGKGKVDVGRFKGLGEMTAAQLKETTMNPATRTIARVVMPVDASGLDDLFEALMGKKPELRFKFIQENANLAGDLDL